MALASLKKRGRSPIMSEINITPLTDIFRAADHLHGQQRRDGRVRREDQPPEVDSTASQPREITVTVTSADEIYVNNNPTSMDQVEGVLRGLVAATPTCRWCWKAIARCCSAKR
jgi:biopolymer transport protein ExbD